MLHAAAENGDPQVDNAPTAAFAVSCVELDCDFDAGASSDDRGLASYSWNFGDNSAANGATTQHSYGADGSFTVTLTVTDTAGQTDSNSKTVVVAADDSNPPACSGCSTNNGSLSGSNDQDFYSSANGFSSNGGGFSATLTGPANADFDLALQRLSNGLFGSSWRNVATSTSNSSSESINYNGNSGTFGLRTGDWKLQRYDRKSARNVVVEAKLANTKVPPFQLFNLANDPAEKTNLIDKEPDVATRLKAQLDRIIDEGRSRP